MAHERAGVLVTCEVNGGKIAVLQRRGQWKMEEGTLAPQKFPGLCQVTCLEKREPDDADSVATAERALLEELALISRLRGRPECRTLLDDGRTHILELPVTLEVIGCLRPEWNTGGFLFVPQSYCSSIKAKGNEGDFNDFGYEGQIVMFNDERQAVVNAFQ